MKQDGSWLRDWLTLNALIFGATAVVVAVALLVIAAVLLFGA